ncbi:MAG TPA: hypothetical protein VHJ40_08970 [Actinomycetota bacterium]|jgi:hypothetical protein|nr:hypothetical protein [Actinomycetota bacterium]
MAEETFTCDDCGRQFPASQMKEFFDDSGKKLELCAEDLDKRMKSEDVMGGPGEEKAAAAYAEDAPQKGPYGERPAG